MNANKLFMTVEKDGRRCRINLCDSWISIHKALKKIGVSKTLYDISMNDSELSISIELCKGKLFSDIAALIHDDDKLSTIHLLCKRIEYGDKEFSELLPAQIDTYESISEIIDDYNDFTTYKYNHLSDEELKSYRKDRLNRNYEIIQLFGKTVLFTNERISNKELPPAIYHYEVREDDEGKGLMAQLGISIWINHWGTILSNHPIKLGSEGYRDINEDKDVEYPLCPYVTLKQYMNEYRQKTIEFSR